MKKQMVFFAVVLSCVMAGLAAAQINVELTSPVNGQKFGDCSDVPLSVNLDVVSGEVKEVRYYAKGIQKGFNRKAPYDDVWEGASNGIYEVWAKAKDTENNEYFSESVFMTVGTTVGEHNVIMNGEFTCFNEKTGAIKDWALGTTSPASASLIREEELWLSEGAGATIEIADGGTENWHIQLTQTFPLDSGHTYEIRFLAESPEAKTIQIACQMSRDPWEFYWGQDVVIQDADIYGPFVYECPVNQLSNHFKFNVGGNTIPISIDGVEVLDEMVSGVREYAYTNGKLIESFIMAQNYPNPFNPATTIQYEISEASQVSVAIFDIQGREVTELVNAFNAAGAHEVQWNGKDSAGHKMASGMYIYTVKATLNHKPMQFSRKMLLVE